MEYPVIEPRNEQIAEQALNEVYVSLCRNAYTLKNNGPVGIEVACKYCGNQGLIAHGRNAGYIPHNFDCPLMICERGLER